MKTANTVLLFIFGRLPFCSLVGAALGAFAGFIFGILQGHESTGSVSWPLLIGMGLILGISSAALMLMILTVALRYRLPSLAFPTIINSLLTSVLTVIFAKIVNLTALTAFLGLFIGILVGAVLCRFCRPAEERA